MSDVLDAQDALDLIDYLVDIEGRDKKAYPGYIHPVTKQPECIVGRAWFIAGASIENLRDLLGFLNPRTVYKENHLPSVLMTVGASEVFYAAQIAQDVCGGTWGNAQDAAHKVADRLRKLVSSEDALSAVKQLVTV